MFLCLFWLLIVGTGFAVILSYQMTGGATGATPGVWPVGAQITRDAGRDTLIFFAHPQCPCTRASLEELNRLLARHGSQVSTHVLFIKPAAVTDDWTKSDLWQSATALPGVSVGVDTNGVLAALFGAETSGYVVLYDASGKLLFQGGITGGRGHAGDNAGESDVAALLSGTMTAHAQTPVYGCSLLNPPLLSGGSTK